MGSESTVNEVVIPTSPAGVSQDFTTRAQRSTAIIVMSLQPVCLVIHTLHATT